MQQLLYIRANKYIQTIATGELTELQNFKIYYKVCALHDHFMLRSKFLIYNNVIVRNKILLYGFNNFYIYMQVAWFFLIILYCVMLLCINPRGYSDIEYKSRKS